MSEQTPTGEWLLTITATGQVHDKDGNLLNQDITGSTQVTLSAAEVQALTEEI